MGVTEQEGSSPAGNTGGTGLRRDVGMIGLLFAGVGSIIGSGWLFGALNAAQDAGPAAIFSWALATVMILLIGLCFAELGTMFPISGGVVRFPHLSFGSFASYTMGWITWLASVSVAPIEVMAVLQYSSGLAAFTREAEVNGDTVHILTGLGGIVAVLLMALFTVINYLGVRFFARINNVLVWWKLAVIIVVIVAFLLTAFHGTNFSSFGFAPSGAEGVFSAIATAGIVFSFLGFRQGVELAGETTNPRRNVPFAVIGSVVICGIIYVLLQVAFIGAVDPADLAGSGGWASLSFANDFGPLAAIASLIGLSWLATVLYIDAVVSPADTGLIYNTATARMSYAMGRNGNAPRSLASVNKNGVPVVSLLVAFVFGLVFFLPFPSWQQLVSFITSATVLSFGAGPLVLAALRRQVPNKERTFRLPGGDVIPFLAFFCANMIVLWAGWDTNWKLMAGVVLGLILLPIFHVVSRGAAPPLDMRSGYWVLVWLVGLTVISLLSDYDGLGVLSLGWAALCMLALSVLIYVLSLRTMLGSDAVEQNIALTTREAQFEDEVLGKE
ncbi:MAG: APC family permease [Pseudonocardia sp.]|nr:APC family permease [Pseudonocardia sp.]